MNFQSWWTVEGCHLEANNYDLAQAAFECGERRHELKVIACLGTLQEMKTICDNTPLNECKTEVDFANVRKQNAAMDRIHDLILQLIDTCKAKDFTDTIMGAGEFEVK